MIRAVIDTNVVVSGLLSPLGNEALIILAVHQGLLRPCLSDEIIDEYAGVLARPKFAFDLEEIEALIAMLRHQGELFEPKVSSKASPDPGDTKFIDCALAAISICSGAWAAHSGASATWPRSSAASAESTGTLPPSATSRAPPACRAPCSISSI